MKTTVRYYDKYKDEVVEKECYQFQFRNDDFNFVIVENKDDIKGIVVRSAKVNVLYYKNSITFIVIGWMEDVDGGFREKEVTIFCE